MLAIKILSVREYGAPTLLEEAASALDISVSELTNLLFNASERIRARLNINDAIFISGKSFRVGKIAGILKLSQNIELEIIPKFLIDGSVSWKEDFYFIASLSRFGVYLSEDKMSSALSQTSALVDSLAETIINQFVQLRRSPIRTYEAFEWRDFVISGDLDDSDYYQYDEDGFQQRETRLSMINVYNKVFYEAFKLLLVEVCSPQLKLKITSCIAYLSPQAKNPAMLYKPLQNRNRKWQRIYMLSLSILKSFKVSYTAQDMEVLPGFLIRTADSWENLMLSSLKSRTTNFIVNNSNYLFGSHSKPSVSLNKLFVHPDISVYDTAKCVLLLDAKYKSQDSSGEMAVSRADIYEMLAFLVSKKVKKGLLLYPAQSGLFSVDSLPGQTCAFERILIQEHEIVGLCINVEGISTMHGYEHFCRNLQTDVFSYIY